MDESDAAGRALDIGEDGLDVGKMHHAAMVSYLGNISAIGSPVKSATQPSGETNSRIAVNIGFGPVSNQLRVPAGTLIRSEERRVGKERVRTCISRWVPIH